MAVHAYLHRKEGAESNADYWYQRAGRDFFRPALQDEWQALVEGRLRARYSPELRPAVSGALMGQHAGAVSRPRRARW